MRKKLVTSLVTGIAILSIASTQSYAMGGGGMGGGGGMSGGMSGGGSSGGDSVSSSSSNSSGGMYDGSQQHMTDSDHAAIQNQHMGEDGAAAMGNSGSTMTSSGKPPVHVLGGKGQQGNSDRNQSGNIVHQQ